MFDIGWPELMVIAVLTVLVVGPKELPRVIRSVSGIIRKVRMMTSEFQSGLDEMAREADLDDIKKTMMGAGGTDIKDEIEKAIDPDGDVKKSFKNLKSDLKKGRDNINSSGKDGGNKDDSDKKPQISRESKAFGDIVNAQKTGVPLPDDNPNSVGNGDSNSLTKIEVSSNKDDDMDDNKNTKSDINNINEAGDNKNG